MQWCAALCALFLLPGPLAAQNALLTSDVAVDVTGQDAAQARTQAMHQAEREGLGILFDRLAPGEKQSFMTGLDDETVRALVKGVEVVEETIDGVRYRGTLRVSYDAVSISAMLDRAPTPAEAEKVPDSTAILVVPLLEGEGTPVLWEQDNAWRAAWNRAIVETGGGHIVAPYADDIDRRLLPAASANVAPPAALKGMLDRYGVGEVAVVRARFITAEKNAIEVMRRHIRRGKVDTFAGDYRADVQETTEALLLRAARDLVAQLLQRRETLIAEAATEGETGAQQFMLVPFTRIGTWVKLRQKLQEMPTVKRLTVTAMSAEQADVVVHFRGSPEALKRDLEGLGMRVQATKDYWIVAGE